MYVMSVGGGVPYRGESLCAYRNPQFVHMHKKLVDKQSVYKVSYGLVMLIF